MSDSMRKGLGDQAAEKITPDSQKSTLDKASETATGLGDKAAGAVQPDSEKSTSQKAGDSVRSGTDDASSEGKSMLGSAQDTLGNAANSASDALGLNKK
ncbi:hypothetical protein K402DRAFT_389019 [Aulographum hederae CBS 113979]|uniref:Chaperone/heat shock protein Hsp12 n=1 Tax=Aulographum hederae CBS 113979 TaxID=1176131 RepID=A0A6G1HEV6_9PEZI|nr:hypothetical protein K402DRAFT_389019 [Aulographum hederae CBS 113979]